MLHPFISLSKATHDSHFHTELEFYAQLSDGSAIEQTHYVTANNVLAQSVISSCSVNIGEASVERTETYYPFIQKLNYLKFSKAAKESIRR